MKYINVYGIYTTLRIKNKLIIIHWRLILSLLEYIGVNDCKSLNLTKTRTRVYFTMNVNIFLEEITIGPHWSLLKQ